MPLPMYHCISCREFSNNPFMTSSVSEGSDRFPPSAPLGKLLVQVGHGGWSS